MTALATARAACFPRIRSEHSASDRCEVLMFETIAELENFSEARALVAALKAYGMHPMEGGETGLPGLPGVRDLGGKIAIQVPENEARDARLLAESLLADMRGNT
jgi:hypothetical protein